MDSQSTQTIKLPILQPGEYDLWKMRMEQYLQCIDYTLWEILSLVVPTFLPGDEPISYLLPIRGIKQLFKMVESPFSKFKEDKAEGKELDKEQLAFHADLRVADTQVAQTITHNATFQTNDLDAYESDCDDISSAKAVLMANLSSCDSDVISEVPYSDTSENDMMNQSVHEFQYSVMLF
ncbi:hypothetical protein Tco_0609327 [Tanacetum coccineum]